MRSIQTLTVSILIGFASLSGWTQTRQVSIVPRENPVMPGQGVGVDVRVSERTGIASGNFTIQFDANMLSAGEAYVAPSFSGYQILTNTTVPGEVSVGFADATGATAPGEGVLFTIPFTVMRGVSGDVNLTLLTVFLFDETGAEISTSGRDGVLSIREATPTPTSTSTSTPTPSPTSTPTSTPPPTSTSTSTPTPTSTPTLPPPPDARRVAVVDVEAQPGSVAYVAIIVTEQLGIASGNITIQYDAEMASAGEVILGSIPSEFTIATNTLAPGEVRVGFFGAAGISAPGQATLFSVPFTIYATAEGPILLHFTQALLFDEAGNAIEARTQDGYINPPITQQSPTPTPTQGTIAPIRVFEFDEPTIGDGDFIELPGGFDVDAPGTLSLAAVPTDGDAFGATDGRGLVFTVGPEERHAILGPAIETDGRPAFIRAAFRSNGGAAAVQIGGLPALNGAPDSSMGLQTSISSTAFADVWKRLGVWVEPPAPSIQVMPFIQIVNLAPEGVATTVYVDRLEVYVLDGTGMWLDAFFGADGTAP